MFVVMVVVVVLLLLCSCCLNVCYVSVDFDVILVGSYCPSVGSPRAQLENTVLCSVKS